MRATASALASSVRTTIENLPFGETIQAESCMYCSYRPVFPPILQLVGTYFLDRLDDVLQELDIFSISSAPENLLFSTSAQKRHMPWAEIELPFLLPGDIPQPIEFDHELTFSLPPAKSVKWSQTPLSEFTRNALSLSRSPGSGNFAFHLFTAQAAVTAFETDAA